MNVLCKIKNLDKDRYKEETTMKVEARKRKNNE